jgi:preprotein translocase subunit SecY
VCITSKPSIATVQINMGIKGVPPGEETVQHLKLKSKQVKFWGGIAMAFLAITAYLFDQVCRQEIGMTLATTSTLILVGAVLQTSRQVSSASYVQWRPA